MNEDDRRSLSASFAIEITAVHMGVWHSFLFHDPLTEADPMCPVLEWEQWANLLPIATWLAALTTVLRHETLFLGFKTHADWNPSQGYITHLQVCGQGYFYRKGKFE